MSSLARAEGMRPQSMSAIVAPLQETGLVKGSPDPGDGRQTLMSLTPKCLKWLQEGRVRTAGSGSPPRSQKRLIRDANRKGCFGLRLLARLIED